MAASTLPPGPRGRLLGGSLHDFLRMRLDFLTACARDHGDVARFRLGPRTVFLVSHPDLIEQVLVTDARHYIKHFGARMYTPVLGNGLILSEGDFWLRQRRLAQPAFLRNRIALYAPQMTALAEAHLRDWRSGQQRDIYEEMSSLTGAIAMKTLFDIEGAEDRKAYNDALREVFEVLGARLRHLVPLPLWVPTPRNVRLRRALRRLDEVVEGFIRTGRARKEPGPDLLSMLLNAQDEDGRRMTDRQLRDETMTLFLAGHETTALTLAWTWYLLAQHPAVEEKLVAEWQAVLGGRTPTIDDLPRLTYTEHVIQEAMRIYPPVYLIGREATRDCELGGYRVRRGTTLMISQWVMHRSPRYFDEPLQFRPERWADGLMQRLPKYAYFPFGGGPRVCIGNTFAMTEAVLLLATVGQRFRFTLEPEPQVTYWASITLVPEPGIFAVLRERA